MDKRLDRTIVESYVKKGLDLLDRYYDGEDVKNEMANLSKSVLGKNNIEFAYEFAFRVGNLLEGDVKKAFNLPAYEDFVIKSGDEEYMYAFIQNINDVNIKKFKSYAKSEALQKSIDKEMEFIN